MIIFSTSDIHGNFIALRKFISFVNSNKNIDVVLFCGDIAGEHEYETVKELASEQIEDYKCFKEMIKDIKAEKVYYILGNHDVFMPDVDDMNYLPNVVRENKEKKFIPFEMVKINYYGINREGNEKDISDSLDKIDGIDKTKIMVTHQPPYDIQDKNILGTCFGSISIKNFIMKNKPLIYFCGHVHEGFGARVLSKTLIINSACDHKNIRGIIVDTVTMKYKAVYLVID